MPDGYGIEEATEYLSWVTVELKLINALRYRLSTVTSGPDAWFAQGAGGLRTLRPLTVLAWTEFPVDMTRFLFD